MDDLEVFRKRWLDELKTEIQDDTIGNSRRNLKRKSSSDANNKSYEQQTQSNKNKKTRTKSLPNAFDIANRYLSSETCHYCEQESLHKECQCNYGIKNNKLNSRLDTSNTTDTENNSKLFELLIADFDEINSIPFFDLELPKEIAVNIFQYLSLKDLTNCSLVNSKWKTLASDDLIWYNLCGKLDIDVGGSCVKERSGWKDFVKECIIDRHQKRRKWKERLCEIREMENEKGGIICTADIHERMAVLSYIDGSVRMWNMEDGSFGQNLKERFTNDDDIILSMCTSIKLSKKICVAGFKNGDVMIWKLLSNLQSQLDFMYNYESREIINVNIDNTSKYICIELKQKQIILKENKKADAWAWEQIHETYHESVNQMILLNSTITPSSFHVLTCMSKQLILSSVYPEESSFILDEIIGATFGCVDSKNKYVVSAVSGIGYSILDGYRIRRYNIATGHQISNLIGKQTTVTCMSYNSNHDDDIIVVGCSDATIRIHSFKDETILLTIHGVGSSIRTLQLDKWKIVSGHEDGTVCLYDSTNGCKYWQMSMRHPIHICSYDDAFLSCVAIPYDKSPQNSYWNADDLVQRKKFRGTFCVMDFSKDVSENIPQEFRADYDNIAGYDYNIDLIAPYDDVTTFNLPQI